MPTIIIRHPDGTTEERDVNGRLTVGCDEENDLVLRAGGVSQRHAQFFADGGELVLENVGSAAATIVDGETISAPRRLKQGVRVLIGDYEVSLKPDQVSVRKLAPVASQTLTDEQPHRSPRATEKSSAGLVVGIVAVLIAVIAVVGFALRPDPPSVVEIPIVPPVKPCADLEPQLRLAREEPSERSLAAANAVLECDPLGPEVLALKRSIEKELKGSAAAERGTKLIELGRDDQALEALKDIPPGTKAFISTRPAALEAAARIQKETSKACLAYARERKWLQAQPVCERAMEIACQSMTADALLKPKDPVLIAMNKARDVNDRGAPKWKCVSVPLLAPLGATAKPTETMEAVIARRYGDPPLAAAVVLYAKGNIALAITQLQVVKEKSSKAALHAQAEALRKDISNVDSLKKIGDDLLKKGQLEPAAKTYREALELDSRVMPDAEQNLSTTRRAITTDMAAAAVKLGTPFAQRSDLPHACAVFRVGFAFYKGSTELNQLLNDCSTQAKTLLDRARSCAQFDRALELAIPGDGLAEDIAAQKAQLSCPR